MTHRRGLPFALTILLALAGCHGGSKAAAKASGAKSSQGGDGGSMRVYLGTYTGPKSKGIYVVEMDRKTGKLGTPRLAAETPSPSYLALHPDGKHLYAVNELDTFDGQKTGAVSAFEIRADDGTLRPLNQQPSGGAGPCHLAVDKAGKSLLVANYGAGSIELVQINSDGSLKAPTASSVVQHQGSSVDKARQEGPHAHCVLVTPESRGADGRALVADLGLDQILVYRFDPRGRLTPGDPPFARAAPGSGPRHIAFGRSGKFVYVNNEMASTLTAYSYDPGSGAMSQLQTVSTLPEGFDKSKNSTAELAVRPDGQFAYVSNRGHNSIAIFRIDPQSGRLTPAGHQSTQGKTPRGFGIDPSGEFLVAGNQDSDTVVVFRIDGASGALTPTGPATAVPSPVSVTFLP